tara:strand:- start:2073 stop:2504 length:432 start_codon:yes stop_codon:yes gene_type:complete
MRNKIIFLILFISKISFSQTEINWTNLEDVEFSERYVEEVDEYVLFPSFGFDVQQLDGKEIILSGYILAIDPEIGYYVLSKGPFASCFFCGAAGPETIVELSLKSKDKSFMMDEFATFKGYLKLNSDDIYRCVYIIEFAEVYR